MNAAASQAKPDGRASNLTNMGQGRKPGVPNRATRTAKQAIAHALALSAHEIAGWLKQVGEEDPRLALQFAEKLAGYVTPRPVISRPPAPVLSSASHARAPAREETAAVPIRINLPDTYSEAVPADTSNDFYNPLGN